MLSDLNFPIAIALAAFLFLSYNLFRPRHGGRLPPGPRPLPFVGNIRDLPPPGRPEYLHWLKFRHTYGPISSVTVLGQPMIIIHDKEAADILLEKSSLKTSGRPTQPFADECGFNEMLPGRQYDAASKRHRKFIHQQLGTVKTAATFNDIQDLESRRLLWRALHHPARLMDHLKTVSNAIILKVTYGYTVEPHAKDPLVALIERMMENFSSAFVPLSWTVDIIPQLRHLPEGFPGTAFKKTARDWRRQTNVVYDTPYSFTQKKMLDGTHQPSYVSSLIQKLSDTTRNGKLSKEDENTIKETAAIIYGGGAESTISTLNSFVIAMILFPEVQKKAQREIDSVVGTSRLPGFEDRERLPYISAIVKESLRWFPVVPIGTTHVTNEDLTYGEYHIPKGSYLLPAIWWFLHDPEVYSDPSSFQPERFLAHRDEPDPWNHAFGYGRRICPGRFFASDSLFIIISRFLATFDVSGATDKDGRKLDVSAEQGPGLVSHPAPYPYVIKSRSVEHANLINAVVAHHPWEESDSSQLDINMS